MSLFNLTPLSPGSLASTAQTFYESWKSLPVEIPLTPLNTLTGCRERLEQMLSQPDIYEVTIANNNNNKPSSPSQDTVLGFLSLNKKEKVLDQLFVHPSAQHLGLGGVLLEVAKTRLRQEDGGFWLRTAEGNLPACKFYEKKGLQFVRRERHPIWGHWTCIYAWQWYKLSFGRRLPWSKESEKPRYPSPGNDTCNLQGYQICECAILQGKITRARVIPDLAIYRLGSP